MCKENCCPLSMGNRGPVLPRLRLHRRKSRATLLPFLLLLLAAAAAAAFATLVWKKTTA